MPQKAVGGDSLKWHKVSKETRDAFIAFHKQNLSVPKAQIEYEKVMIAEHGEEAWNRLSADRSICPDNKWAYHFWHRLNLVSRGSLNAPDAFITAVESVKAYNEKHGKELATLHQKKINGRIEIYACVVDAFASRAHKLLPQAGDIIAVDATLLLGSSGHKTDPICYLFSGWRRSSWLHFVVA